MSGKEITRRDFLGLSLAVGGAVAIAESLFVGLRFLSPKKTMGNSEEYSIWELMNSFLPEVLPRWRKAASMSFDFRMVVF